MIVDPARKIRVGNKLYFGEQEELVAEVIDNTTSRGRTIRFLWEGTEQDFRAQLENWAKRRFPNTSNASPTKKTRSATRPYMPNMRVLWPLRPPVSTSAGN